MKKLFLLLIALLPMLSFADNVSQEKAQVIAERFFSSSKKMMAKSASSVSSLRMIWNGEGKTTRSNVAPAFYVFNNEAGKGFVIVSGDDRTASPILAYSFDQNFNAENMPENLYTWMNGIRSEINQGRAQDLPVTPAAKKAWALFEHNEKEPIKLLETALWDQGAPYNSKLPLGYVTGCPATAISIIMRYHQWPDKGVGTIPQSDPKIPSITLGHTYDWANMPLNYTGASKEQNEQVGILMRDVGAMIRTQYGGGTAGARPEETLPQLMPIYMRYNKSTIKSLFKSNFSDAEWHKLMQKELDENRPVLYGGYSSGGGHQFVLDGYAADNFYHVNWGWSGVSNGYYLLTGMNPPKQGTGGSSSVDGFTQKQDAIIGIQPDKNNPGGGFFDLIAYKQFYKGKPYGLVTTSTEFEQNVDFKVDIKDFWNKGSRDFKGEIAIAHYGQDGTFKNIISDVKRYNVYYIEINGNTEAYFKCKITDPIENGDYLCGVYKFLNPAEWTPIYNGEVGNDQCVEKITLKEGDVPNPPITTYNLNVTVGEGGKVICKDVVIEGSSSIQANKDEKVAFTIVANEGYKIASVLYNQENVTASLVENVYTTPAITAASTLDVTFEKDETGIAQESAREVSVSGYNGSVVVKGLKPAMPVVVYTFDGILVTSVEASAETVQLALQTGRAYIVRVADRSFKVQL